MAVAAGVVGDAGESAILVTDIDVSPQPCGSAADNISEGFFLFWREGVVSPIVLSMEAKDIHDLKGQPRPSTNGTCGAKLRHGSALLLCGVLLGTIGFLDQIQGAAGEAEEAVGDVGISLGGLNGGMAEEGLDHAEVVSGF